MTNSVEAIILKEIHGADTFTSIISNHARETKASLVGGLPGISRGMFAISSICLMHFLIFEIFGKGMKGVHLAAEVLL